MLAIILKSPASGLLHSLMPLFIIRQRIAGRAVVVNKLLQQKFLIARRQIKAQTGLFNCSESAIPLLGNPLKCMA